MREGTHARRMRASAGLLRGVRALLQGVRASGGSASAGSGGDPGFCVAVRLFAQVSRQGLWDGLEDQGTAFNAYMHIMHCNALTCL